MTSIRHPRRMPLLVIAPTLNTAVDLNSYVTVSNAAPFTVSTLVAGTSFIENGRAKYERAQSLYRACTDVNYWPDDGEDEEIEIHPWQAYRAPLARYSP